MNSNATEPELITPAEIAHLDKLFDGWDGVIIETDEDLARLADDFPENE